jgi:predicted peptidase
MGARFSRHLILAIVPTLVALPAAAATDLSNSITGSVSDGAASINYRLFQPQGVTAGEKVPLVLFLHGMGDRGTDNVGQTYWMGQLQQHTSSGQYAAYVLAPQIDSSMWFSSNSSTPTEAMKLTISALKQAMADPHVDTSRIYVTGVSMGSFGTWDILRREPNLFAAAVPMSGGGDPSTASTIKDVPIWAFHGSADDVVNVQSTRDMVAALEAVGGNVKYTEVEGGDHFIWPQIYGDASNTLYSWLFSQHLSEGLDTTLAAASLMQAAPSLSVAVTTATAVPEPASIGLIAVGGMILLKRRWR